MRGVLIMVLLAVASVAQMRAQTIPDFTHHMKFRLYGSDMHMAATGKKHKPLLPASAKPITQSDTCYDVSVDYRGGNQEGAFDILTDVRQGWEDSVYYVHIRAPLLSLRQSVLRVDGPMGRMNVETGVGLDSVHYAPGNYAIPPSHWSMFEIKGESGIEIRHRDVLSFKQGEERYREAGSIQYQTVLRDAWFAELKRTKQWIYARTGNHHHTQHHLWRSDDDGYTWEQVVHDKPVVKLVPVPGRDDRLLAVLFDGDRYSLVWLSDGQNQVTTDTALTRLQVYDLLFVSAQVGIALSKVGDGTARAYRTRDGGQTWHRLGGEALSDQFRLVGFRDSLNGYIVQDRGYSLGAYLQTQDGGRSWMPYTLHDKESERFSPAEHLPVMDNRSYGNLAINKEGVLVTVHTGLVWRLVSSVPGLREPFQYFGDDVVVQLGRGFMFYSQDAGKTWRYLSGSVEATSSGSWSHATGYLQFPMDVLFIDERTLLVLDDKEVVRVQVDGF